MVFNQVVWLSLSGFLGLLSFAVTILEAGKKELVKREEGLVKLIT